MRIPLLSTGVGRRDYMTVRYKGGDDKFDLLGFERGYYPGSTIPPPLINWSFVAPVGGIGNGWTHSRGISSLGDKVVSGRRGVWISLDTMASWNKVYPSGGTTNHFHATISADGLTMLAGQSAYGGDVSGRIYISTDDGVSWSETQPDGAADRDWSGVAINNDGQIMIACSRGRGIFKSINGGTSWADITPSGGGSDKDYMYPKVSDDGQIIAVSNYKPATTSDRKLWISVNGGTSWTDRTPEAKSPPYCWEDIGMSADGGVILTQSAGNPGSWGNVFTTVDQGANWTLHYPNQIYGPTDTSNWRECSVSRDGLVWLCMDGDGMFVSYDLGVSPWTYLDLTVLVTTDAWAYNDCQLNGDGSIAFVQGNSGDPDYESCFFKGTT